MVLSRELASKSYSSHKGELWEEWFGREVSLVALRAPEGHVTCLGGRLGVIAIPVQKVAVSHKGLR